MHRIWVAYAHTIAAGLGLPAFIVDPVSVDEFIPEARISGIPDIQRRPFTLNIRLWARQAPRTGHELGTSAS